MTRASRLNAALAAAVIGLGLFAWLKPRSDAPADHPVSSLKPEAVRSISVERPGAPPIALERRGEEWFVTAPLAARADPVRVQRLLAIAGARATARLVAADLGRFELEAPAARVKLDGQAFDFGVVNAVSREQYLLTGGTVYTVAPVYGAALPARAGDVVDRQLLGRGEVPESIALAEFTVAREEGKWVLKPPRGEPSQDDIQRWVDDWRHASALRVEPYAGKGAPGAIVSMKFREGTALAVGILSREPELALLRPDEKLVYYLFKGSAQRLLSPPAEGK